MRRRRVSFEQIPFPTGQTNPQLHQWQLQTAAVLRRILQDITGGASVDLASIQTAIAQLQADVALLNASGGGALTAQQVYELGLVTAADTVLGSLSEIYTRQKTQLEEIADAVLKTSIEAHRGTTGIRSQVSVSYGQATMITSLMAGLGVSNANIDLVQRAAATGDTAAATNILSTQTTVAGNTASITTLQSSVNGINAQYTIQLSVQGRVIGTQTIAGTPQGSVFAVEVDKFQVGNATYTNKPVFAISTVNGAADIAFHGNMYADGDIFTRHLQASAVTTAKIAAGAVVADKIAANTITADKLSVTALSAIAADLGTVTAGLIQNSAGTLKFDLPNMKIYRTDNTMIVDWANKIFQIDF